MKKIAAFFLAAAASYAQVAGIEYHRLRIISDTAAANAGEIDFASVNNGNYIGLAAPNTLAGTVLFRLPGSDGAPNSCLVTDGSHNLSFITCPGSSSLTPPVTLSASISSPILTLTQSGSGLALQANGEIDLAHGSGFALRATGDVSIANTVPSIRSLWMDSIVSGTNKHRWQINVNNVAESGGNAGSDFQIDRYDDNGNHIDFPIYIYRSTGTVNIEDELFLWGDISAPNATVHWSGAHIQDLGTGDGPTFGSVTAAAFSNPGWNFNGQGANTLNATKYYVSNTLGFNGTCSVLPTVVYGIITSC